VFCCACADLDLVLIKQERGVAPRESESGQPVAMWRSPTEGTEGIAIACTLCVAHGLANLDKFTCFRLDKVGAY
jgi:hypothetical protein